MNKLQQILNKSYPSNEPPVESVFRSVGFGLFVGLFLFFFKPFGLHHPEVSILREACIYFGLITSGIVLFNTLALPRLIPAWFREEKWTVGREILMICWSIFLIGIGNTLLLKGLGWSVIPFWELLVGMELKTLGIGIFPVSMYVVYDQNRLLAKHLQKAQVYNQHFHAPEKKEMVEEAKTTISIADEQGTQSFEFDPSTLLFISSDRNYLDVYYAENESFKKEVIRNRLKAVEELLPSGSFFRCHRSFLVNTEWVENVEGNARGYSLHLKNSDFIVPVSRNKIPEMEERFQLK